MDLYPVNLDVDDRLCVVVGAGAVGDRKIGGLVACGARVKVIAPYISAGVRKVSAGGSVTLVERTYQPDDLDGAWLVIACTDDPAVNHRVYLDATARGVWANSADDPANCSFTLPSVARRGDLTLTASTAGRSPALSAWFRRSWVNQLDERWDAVIDVLSQARTQLRETTGSSEVPGWAEALDGGVVELILEGRVADARSLLHGALGLEVAA